MKSNRSYTFWQRLRLNRGHVVFLGNRIKLGWVGEMPFYAFRCEKHGIFEDYSHGYGNLLKCPECVPKSKSLQGEEERKCSRSYTFWEMLKMRLGHELYLEHRTKPGWVGEMPFYASYCKLHGIFEDYYHTRYNLLDCPECVYARAQEITKNGP